MTLFLSIVEQKTKWNQTIRSKHLTVTNIDTHFITYRIVDLHLDLHGYDLPYLLGNS